MKNPFHFRPPSAVRGKEVKWSRNHSPRHTKTDPVDKGPAEAWKLIKVWPEIVRCAKDSISIPKHFHSEDFFEVSGSPMCEDKVGRFNRRTAARFKRKPISDSAPRAKI
jgi:hypothetical protein